jgi:hypothetical protein
MLTSSAKEKGRRLQKWVRDKLLEKFPQIDPEDLKSTSMGVNGLDIQMSRLAQSTIPYGFEMKNMARFAVYQHYEQAARNTHKAQRYLEPVLVIKGNHKRPLAVVDAEHFFSLLRDRYDMEIERIRAPE